MDPLQSTFIAAQEVRSRSEQGRHTHVPGFFHQIDLLASQLLLAIGDQMVKQGTSLQARYSPKVRRQTPVLEM